MILPDFLLIFVIIFFVASIPVELIIHWLFLKARQISNKLTKPTSHIYFSKAPIQFLLINAANFSKGFFAPLVMNYFSGDELLVLATIPMVLIAHNWPFFLKFRNRMSLGIVLWGVFSYIYLPLFLLFPLGYILFSFTLNSFYLGTILTILSAFFVYWYMGLSPFLLPLNFLVFLIVSWAYRNPLFQHLEKDKITILKSFLERS